MRWGATEVVVLTETCVDLPAMASSPKQMQATTFASGHRPRALGEKYLLLEEIGRGGMASVHLARTRGLGGGRVCAVKTVAYQPHVADDGFLSSRFLQEAAAVSQLQHDNLVFVFDSGVVDRELFLAMEFIEGRTLSEVMSWLRSSGQTLPIGLSMWLVLELLAGLAYVHRKGYVHRDVTPSNVMISVSGAVKLLDFGMVRQSSDERQTGMVTKLGKAGYMAPEQFLGIAADPRADIFSVGVILWELLAGKAWLSAGEKRQRNMAYQAPHLIRPEVPQELSESLSIALADDPVDRFQSAQEFQADLARYLAPGDYRKRVGDFLTTSFGAALEAERQHREALLASEDAAANVSPSLSDVGPIKRLEDYVGLVIGDRYEIKRLMATGAMGAVYEARHIGIDRRVALKIPLFRGNSELRARFVREAQATSKINDRHVVVVTDGGETPQGDAFVVMEYLEGESLEDALLRRGPLLVDEALDVALQMAKAMEAAHAASVIHRDLKPANVMLVPTREGTAVKVLDFGIAAFLSQDAQAAPVDGLTLPEVSLGSPRYMAPEQIASDDPVDARADVYAAATVLFEMLTGEAPFEATEPEDICAAKLTGSPRDIRQLAPNLPESICSLVMSGLARKPAERPSSAADWRARLEGLRPDRRRGAAMTEAPQVRRKWWFALPAAIAFAAAAWYLAAKLEGNEVQPNPVNAKKVEVLAPPPQVQPSNNTLPIQQPPPAPPTIAEAPVKPSRPTKPSTPALAEEPAPQWQAPLQQAQVAFDQGRFIDCLLAAKRAARLGAGAKAFVLIGKANLEMQEPAEAAAAFRSALVLDPGNAEAERGLGRAGSGQ